MSRSKFPDVLEWWGYTWAKTPGHLGWRRPALTDPEDPMLAGAVAYGRIVRRDGHYVMEDPGLTLDRFTWHDGDLIRLPREDAEEAP